MRGLLHMFVAVGCYGAAVVSLVYLIGFVGACPALPSHVDKGMQAPFGAALAVDVALIALFGVQHPSWPGPASRQA